MSVAVASGTGGSGEGREWEQGREEEWSEDVPLGC